MLIAKKWWVGVCLFIRLIVTWHFGIAPGNTQYFKFITGSIENLLQPCFLLPVLRTNSKQIFGKPLIKP